MGFSKANPDAQYYWRKFLVNFNDLCLIIAYTAADGKIQPFQTMDDDSQGLNYGKVDISPWTDFFLSLCWSKSKKGSKTNNTFSKRSMENTCFTFVQCKISVLNMEKIAAIKKLFKYYCEMRSLLERKAHSLICIHIERRP
ncbi:hypothetical protein NC652_030718 [Populus alba x Populus x berolinensis]|nr:hypothetical protein NC652_030718 [Populus alba x Populus x berolinensis]